MHGHRLLDDVATSDKGQSSLIFGSEKMRSININKEPQ